MLIEIEDFYNDLQAEVSNSASIGSYHIEAFMMEYLNELIDVGDVLDDVEPCDNPRYNGIYVNGYQSDQQEDGGIRIDLFVTDYSQRRELERLSRSEIDLWFKRVLKFFTESLNEKFYDKCDISSTIYNIAEYIWVNRENIEQVNLFFLSERLLSERVTEFSKVQVPKINVNYHLYDIERLYNLKNSTRQKESIEIDFVTQYSQGIECLVAHLGGNSLESYLAVVPGTILANVYNDYGERLLEQNVRSFLQARGKVNKGIRDTILNEPTYFFSYNNGITATASNIELREHNGQTQIAKILDLQIVNGGQTTASLGRALSKDNADLSQVFVQMKISVIDNGKSDEVVPRISEFANTQNKVNISDLSANHPYHIKIEELSRKIWAPRREGELRETCWFYERSRGQYNVMLASKDSKKEKNKYPKSQVFNKTDLAKYMMIWDSSEPKWVNMGAQKNFVKFSEIISKEWRQVGFVDKVNEFYFKKLVCRAIIFKDTEKMIRYQPWYTNGYRANIVIYSLAYLSDFLKRCKLDLDYASIWSKQMPSQALREVIKILAEKINGILTGYNPYRTTSNISEWAKKDNCWNDIINHHGDSLDSCFTKVFAKELVHLSDTLQLEKIATKEEKVDNELEIELKILSKEKDYWKQFLNYLESNTTLTYVQKGILVTAQNPSKLLSSKQCKVLNGLLIKFEKDFEASF